MTASKSTPKALLAKIQEIAESPDSDSQEQKILRAMLGLARSVMTEPDGDKPRSLELNFDDAYEPLEDSQVNRLLALEGGPNMIVQNEPIAGTGNGLDAQSPEHSVTLKVTGDQ